MRDSEYTRQQEYTRQREVTGGRYSSARKYKQPLEAGEVWRSYGYCTDGKDEGTPRPSATNDEAYPPIRLPLGPTRIWYKNAWACLVDKFMSL